MGMSVDGLPTGQGENEISFLWHTVTFHAWIQSIESTERSAPFFSVEGGTLTLPVMSIIAIGRRLKRRVNEKILKSDSGPDVRLVV